MSRVRAALKPGKSYEYPWSTRAVYNFVLMPFTVGMFGFAIYLTISETGNFIPGGFLLLSGIVFFGALSFGVMFNYCHLGAIIVNDREITSLKRTGTVSIPWKEIDEIYYKIGRGKQLPEDPFFTVYIFSKNKDFIIVNREIEGIRELMDAIRQFADTSRVKYISFRQLVKLFVGLYLPRLTSGRNRA